MSWEIVQERNGTVDLKRILYDRLSGEDTVHATAWMVGKLELRGLAAYACMFEHKYFDSERHSQEGVGVVIMIEPQPQEGRFHIKVMDEREGPLAYDCPKEVLDLLTPTDDPKALAWRARCKERLGCAT
jgi:hypothetical protein